MNNHIYLICIESCAMQFEKTGEEVNQIQAWVHTHRGIDESKPLILNTPEATKCLVCAIHPHKK